MKWAIFEFEDLSCEVGETAWIYGEDEMLFNNDDWCFSKQVIVKWPKDCSKWKRLSSKTSVNINEVEVDRCAAKIIKFSDKHDAINEHLKDYLNTGSTVTPSRGRGHRVSRRNPFYEDDSDVENSPVKKTTKKPRKENTENKGEQPGKKNLLKAIKRKYNIAADKDEEELEQKSKSRMVNELECLKQNNEELRNQVGQLSLLVYNLKDIIQDFKGKFQDTSLPLTPVQCQPPATPSYQTVSPDRAPLMELQERTTTPLPTLTKPCISNPRISSPGSKISEDKLEIGSGLFVLPAQKKMLDVMGNAKTYIYAAMEMLWPRDVLATHSLTGKASNAHKDKCAKPSLDHTMVTSLIEVTKRKFPLTSEKEIKTFLKSKLNNIEKCHKLKKKDN